MDVDLSLVIPVYNEEASLRELVAGIARGVPEGCTCEILLVDDGSTDGSWATISALAAEQPAVRGIRLVANYGKSAALTCGFQYATGRLVLTMDSDLQDDPAEIPSFLAAMASGRYDLVCGWRRHRQDTPERRAASSLFNTVVRALTGVQLHDMNIGYKCMRREVARSLRLSSDLHRFIPVLAWNAGFRRLGEIEVRHRPRRYGRSKYGFRRYRRGFIDLLTVMFLARCRDRPLQFMGPVGLIVFLLGLVAGLAGAIVGAAQGLLPAAVLLTLAAVLVLAGVQCCFLGLIGELIVSHHFQPQGQYLVGEERP